MNELIKQPDCLTEVRIRLHSVKNISGVLGMLEYMCSKKTSIQKEYELLEAKIRDTNNYLYATEKLQDWVAYLKGLPKPNDAIATHTHSALEQITERIQDIEQELLNAEAYTTRTHQEMRERIVRFVCVLNKTRSRNSAEVVFETNQLTHKNKLLILELPSPQYTYPNLFRACIRNLIANARKYTEEGDVIHFALVQNDQGLTLTISDSGMGIPKDEINKVIESGYQASNNTGKGFGFGMGLTVVKYFCNTYSGTLTVESPKDQGTRITMELPPFHHYNKASLSYSI